MIDILVVAAGQGARMKAGKNKLFLEIEGKPILYLTLSKLQKMSQIRRIIPVMKFHEFHFLEEMQEKYGALDKVDRPVEGGKERADSVRNGLAVLLEDQPSEVIMVHDGARPFISERMINDLYQAAKDIGCAIPVMPVVETVREFKNEATKVVNRDHLRLIQTPQAFLSSLAQEVFLEPAQNKKSLTDEASFFEELQKPLSLVQGEKYNIKITQQQDLNWAKALIYAFKELQS